MTDPGWYHAQGDPKDSVRYWDGAAWAGEATYNPGSSGVVYYAAVTEEPAIALTARRPVEHATLGDTRVKEMAPVPPPGARIPASAQLIAIVLSALKAIPLALMLLNAILVAVFGTIGLSLAYNQDVENVLAAAIGITLLMVAGGAALLVAQALGASRGNPVLLLVPALLLVGVDGLLAVGAWSAGLGTERFFLTGVFLLQGWVFIGAIIGMVKAPVAPTVAAAALPSNAPNA